MDERVANSDGAVLKVADGINVVVYSPPSSAVLEEVAIQFPLCLPGLAGGDEDGVLEPEEVFRLQGFRADWNGCGVLGGGGDLGFHDQSWRLMGG